MFLDLFKREKRVRHHFLASLRYLYVCVCLLPLLTGGAARVSDAGAIGPVGTKLGKPEISSFS